MVPAALGGAGAGFAEYAAVAYELARGNGATALVFNMHASVTGALGGGRPRSWPSALGVPEEALAARDATAARRGRRGAWYAVAMSERGVGVAAVPAATVYEPVDGGFRIKGAKTFCLRRRARRRLPGGGPQRGRPVGGLPVPGAGRTPGLTVEPTWDSLGMRATASHDLHLDVTVPADRAARRRGGARPGGGPADAALAGGQLRRGLRGGGAGGGGRGGGARRTRAGWAGLPAVRARIGRADAAVAAARLVVAEAARRVDEAPGDAETNRWVWRAKLLAGTTAAEVAASMLEAAGTSATRRGHPLERLYRDARCGSLQPGHLRRVRRLARRRRAGRRPGPTVSTGVAPRW